MKLSPLAVLLVLSMNTTAQVDITKYASDDLFKVNSVITETSVHSKSDRVASNFEEEMTAGLTYIDDGELDDALDHFLNMSDKYDQVPNLKYLVGLIYYMKNDLNESLDYMNQAFVLEPLFLEPLYYRSLIKARQKRFKEANQDIDRLSDVPDYSALGLFGKGVIATMQKDYFRAIKMYKKCIEADSSFTNAYIPLIELELVYMRKPTIALKYADRAVAFDSEWEQALIIRGMISVMVEGDIDQFEEDINKLVEINPYNYHYHSLRGFLNAELDKYDQAIEDFTKALNLEIDTTNRGEYKFSTTLSKDIAIRNALNYYRQHRPDFNQISRNYVNRSLFALISSKPTDALKYLDSLQMSKEPATVSLIKGIAWKQNWNGKDQAIRELTKAIELDSSIFFAFEERGSLYAVNGLVNEAMSDYSMLIKLKPKSKVGYKERGTLRLSENEYMKAYRDFSVGLAIDTTDWDLYFNRGTSAFYMGKFDAALGDFRKVLVQKPKDDESYFMSYLCFLNKRDSSKALAHLDSASLFGKYKNDFHTELIAFGKLMNNTEVQINAYSRLVRYNSYDKKYRLERAKLYFKEKRDEEALKDLKHFVKYRKKNGEGYHYLSQVHLRLGNEKEALKCKEKSKKFGYIGK